MGHTKGQARWLIPWGEGGTGLYKLYRYIYMHGTQE